MGSQWCSSVPVFAQTLGFTPLTPVKPTCESAHPNTHIQQQPMKPIAECKPPPIHKENEVCLIVYIDMFLFD